MSRNSGLVTRRNANQLAGEAAASDYYPNVAGKVDPATEQFFRRLVEDVRNLRQQISDAEKKIPAPVTEEKKVQTDFLEIYVNGVRFRAGNGTPEGVVQGNAGNDIYFQKDGGAGTCLWVKETGNQLTGWASK